MELSKLDVATRQLATAIRILFSGGDVVSAFSLATNAWEVIDAVAKHRGIGGTHSNLARTNISPDLDLKKDFINSAGRNFFKHADKAPDAVLLEFDEENVIRVIHLAVEDLVEVTQASPIEAQVFQLWHLGLYQKELSEEVAAAVMPRINELFPGIDELPSDHQKAIAHWTLTQAYKEPELLLDHRTTRLPM